MAKFKASNVLVKELNNWKINHVYGIPGDSIDPVVDALKKAERVRGLIRKNGAPTKWTILKM